MPVRTSQTLYSIGPVPDTGSISSASVDTNVVPADVSGQPGWNTVDDALEGLDTTQQSLLAQDAAFMASLTNMQSSLGTAQTEIDDLENDLGDVANTSPIDDYNGA